MSNVVVVSKSQYTPPENLERDAKVAELNKLQASLKARRYVCKDQVAVLSSYSENLSGKGTSAAELIDFLDTYASKRNEIQEESNRLKEEIEKVNKELSAILQSEKHTMEADAERASEVLIIVSATQETKGEIVLSYRESLCRL